MSKDSDDYLDEETFGCSGSESGDSPSATDFQCEICKDKLRSPRVLPCLHVFCLACLQKLLDGSDEEGEESNDEICCPSCSHKTKMNGKPASSLLVAFVNANILDMEAVRAETVVCTSCKSEDGAVARCADCANFLCPSCNQAHQVMRCFENHHVHSLEQLKESSLPIPIHKPVNCTAHPIETVKFFCVDCQVPLCGECVGEHKAAEHSYERVTEAEFAVREELRLLVAEARVRIEASDEACCAVMASLSELEASHDNARALIEETYQSYKAVLESARDARLEELTKLHHERELAVMELMSSIEAARPHMEMAAAFTNALIELGDAAELVASHRVVRDRLNALLATPLDPKVDVSLLFESSIDEFKRVVEKHFGKFKTAEPKQPTATSPTVHTVPTSPTSPTVPTPPCTNPLALAFSSSLNKMTKSPMIYTESSGLNLLGSTISIPTSGITSSGDGSPTSLKSSCDSDLSALSSPYLHPGLDLTTPPLSQAQAPSSLAGLTMMAEYNLQRLANLELTDPPGSVSSPAFTLADMLGSDLTSSLTSSHAINNLQALAKLDAGNGIMSDHTNGHGQSMLDGCYGNMSTHSSPPLSDMGMNGFNGVNGMNNMHDYGMSRRMGPVNGINSMTSMNGMNSNGMNGSGILGGMNSMGGVGGLGGCAMAAIGGMNSFPLPRKPSGNVPAMTVRYKYGQLGSAKGQFNSPHGFCLGNDEEVIVADTNNHRIQIFEKDGSFKYQFGSPGREEGQLWYPRKVALMMKCGKFVVCDRGNERSRMQIFTKNGHFVRKISIRYIDIVAGLAVTPEGFIVAVDSVSPTVFILNENGNLIQWFDCANFMREPSDIAINGDEYFVCDFKGHCVVVFSKDGTFQRRIGQEGITNFPNGIDVSDDGDVLVGDSHGNRFHVTVFNRNGQPLSEVECPYVKVSRCCGLKLSREGMIVTLAKNNHHVLILSTIFVT